MVSLPHRMRKLQTRLLAIRLGSGAYILPKDINRIHMRFAPRIEGGHMGPRKFWHHELVRLKYHNPAISMTTDRTARAEDPAVLSVHFTSPTPTQSPDETTSGPAFADSTPAAAQPTERVSTIDMKHRTNAEILDELVRMTKAQAVEATEAEREELRSLEEQRVKGAKDSAKSLEVRARVAREKQLLEQARGELAADAV
ncbi:hypothetical protein LTR91_007517 [Friedmanniomyces endolithicus]|uniref:Ribosomal protein/NADH dehydrogenase domain-containing protein n=1 Tax=Friedmanniomyces endolithicus TaxID=329885 RepID=A0AAN6QW64_9PEZI|nr:hypothetical protein LTR75_014693 [Friedmanniomyces endolithicus]KAK0828830.1 hypothetical protein LTR03_016399 [Friedmanniomyces endolithicus]KAK0862696.1 hypothetical protein LTS02_007071 [Friedmanniomyces endolithicus]KAK0875716.1 hypothetical protein LTR87_010406 [Friedmanniomyces endolithicus]KAK0912182.1 hypothetical protein LTR02_003056 [Friedmanniomyces endolithicus]